MEVSKLITLCVAIWGAILSTYHWWVLHQKDRRSLKIFAYWSGDFVVRIQNVGTKPVEIRELYVRGRFLRGLSHLIFREEDEEFRITYPENNGEPVILQPQDIYTEVFVNLWSELENFESERQRKIKEEKLSNGALLQIRSLVILCRDGENRIHVSKPYDLSERPAPVYSGKKGEYVFNTPIRLPKAKGLRKTPWPLLINAWFRKAGPIAATSESSILPANISSEIFEIDNNENLCREVCNFICRKNDFAIHRVSEYERIVVLVATTQEIIDEGGLVLFFSKNFPDTEGYDYFINAYKEIGSEEVSVSLGKALLLFPSGKPQESMVERKRYIYDNLGGEGGKLSEYEDTIRGLREVHFERLANYIRANKESFI